MSEPDARRVAYEVVRRTFEQGAYADRAFAGEASGLEGRERRQAMRMAYGAVQRMRTVDHAVEQLGGRRPMRLQAPLRNALRVSGYELLFSDAVPARAAVSEGVDLARDVAGAQVAGLANAVLRRIAEAGSEWVETLPRGLRFSYPDWVMEEWTALMGADGANACADAQNRPAELCVRVNTLRSDAPELGAATRKVDGLPEALVLEEMIDVTDTDAFASGAVWPQSRSSMRPARMLDPRPGMRVLDLCAAPGGKSGQLAALMENRGELVCVERHAGRAAELERTLARARADSLSKLVAEERRIGEERRAALEERERRASAELSEALARVEQRVSHRLAELSIDLERTEQSLSTQLKALADRQKQLMSKAESRLVLETERLDAASEAQRERLSTLDEHFSRTADEIAQSGQQELESHERDRRRALHEVAERLRHRERDLRERIAAEEAEAIQRIQAGFADIERRQLDQLKRVVERTAASFSEAVSKQFADAIRGARDDAAQRLSRELDRAVQHFAKEAQSVLADRLAHVADAGGQRLERRLSEIGSSLEHERDELMAELQRRIGDAEVELRSQVQSLAADAEAERTVLNARLQDLQRRIDEAVTEAGSRLAPTFRGS